MGVDLCRPSFRAGCVLAPPQSSEYRSQVRGDCLFGAFRNRSAPQAFNHPLSDHLDGMCSFPRRQGPSEHGQNHAQEIQAQVDNIQCLRLRRRLRDRRLIDG